MSLSATQTKLIVYPENTQGLKIVGLKDESTDPPTYLNGASVVATLVDDQGNVVPGCVDVPLTNVPASNGDYIGEYGDANFAPSIGTGYTMIIKATQGGNSISLGIDVEVQRRVQ